MSSEDRSDAERRAAEERSLVRARSVFENQRLVVQRLHPSDYGGRKVPDFLVSSDAGSAFFCEVKSPQLIFDKEANCYKHTTTYRKLSDHITAAAKQFESVNSRHIVPNVLFWNSEDFQLNFSNLIEVLRGWSGVGGRMYVDFRRLGSVKSAQKRLRTVDLHIWLQDEGVDLKFIPTFTDPFLGRTLIKTLNLDHIPRTTPQAYGL